MFGREGVQFGQMRDGLNRIFLIQSCAVKKMKRSEEKINK